MSTPTLSPAVPSRPVAARRSTPVARRSAHVKSVSPAPTGPFIDGRADYDWSLAPAFALTPTRSNVSVLPGVDAPRAISPPDGAVSDVAAIVLAWSHDLTARGFDVELSPRSDFSSHVLQLSTDTSTELSLAGMPVPAGARLYWRVRARGAGAVSRWSAPARFYAGGPRDVDAYQAREATRQEEARREHARRHSKEAAAEDLVPPYLRDAAVTTELETALPVVMFVGTGLAICLAVLVGLLG